MAEEDGPSRRARDLAILLPVLGTVLLVPPLVGLFARGDARIVGVPLVVLYLFGLWLALIVGALLLTRRLGGTAPDAAE